MDQDPAIDSTHGETSTESPCGLLRRMLAIVYDSIIVTALLMLAASLVLMIRPEGMTALRDPIYTAYLLIVWFLYLAWCWRQGGMTLGMRAWRVRVVDEQGKAPGWGQCIIRFVVSFLSAAVLGGGFAWCLIDKRKRAWHDMASRTRLVTIRQNAAKR